MTPSNTGRTSVKLRELDARDPAVQRFLWGHFDPSVFRHDYSPLDGLNYIVNSCLTKDAMLVGDLDVGFVFYAEQRNPKVLEPHIIGNGLLLREAFRQGIGIATTLGYEQIVIWTQDERLVRMCQKFGFTLNGHIPKLHLHNGQLTGVHVLSMEIQTCGTLLT
jgi:hypothetical protein